MCLSVPDSSGMVRSIQDTQRELRVCRLNLLLSIFIELEQVRGMLIAVGA